MKGIIWLQNMGFINEAKRYWSINLKDYKKSIVPILFNIVIVFFMYILLDDMMTETYVVSYCIAWLLLTSQLSLTQEMLQDLSKRRMKYYFMGENSLTKVYFFRYIIVCAKYTILFGVFVKLMYVLDIVQYDIRIYEILLIYIGLVSLFFINYILTLIVVVNKKMLMTTNFLKCIILFFLIKDASLLLPASYVISNLGNNFFLNMHFDIYDGMIIGVNGICYTFIGYFICVYFTNVLKYKLAK